ncbi:MAG: hypothetical protein JNM17_04135 [Archangium sp.]|nr:hypothetical protein [Archangium sp.]
MTTDIALRISGDGSGGESAFQGVADEAVDSAATIEQAFASLSKKTEEAFSRMERETAASMKKMSDEGAAAWKRAEAAEAAHAKSLAQVQAGFLAVGAAVVAFGADSVQAFAEAQRVQKQLELQAGDLAGAFAQQADALERQLAIDGEVIKQQQTMLLQWGATPEAIEPAIRAISDYSARTGKDAVTATRDFLKAVDNGDEKLKVFGVTFEQTGDRAADFKTLTEAMTAALGGSAEANKNTLAGSLASVEIAFGNVKEAFGEMIASLESKLGVLDKTATALQRIARNVSGSSGFLETLNALSPGGLLVSALGIGDKEPELPDISGPATMYLGPRGDLIGPDGKRPKTIQEVEAQKEWQAAARKSAEEMEKLEAEAAQLAETLARQTEEWERNHAAVVGNIDAAGLSFKQTADLVKDAAPLYDTFWKTWQKNNEKAMKASDEAMARWRAEADASNLKAEQSWMSMGDRIGAAFVNGLTAQMQKLAQGGEFDVALFVGDVLASVAGIAATAIGSYFGAPAIGAAVGNLAALGIRAGAQGISNSNKKQPKTYHAGGWVGDEADIPRYHSGSWVGGDERLAILQRDERVLSRSEVQNAGGKSQVDAMARGRPMLNVTLTAIDVKTGLESFMTDLGTSLRMAQQSGQGEVPALLGVPR